MFAYPYYGPKCSSFFLGSKSINWYNAFSSSKAVIGSVVSLNVVVAFCDITFALLAFPNMFAALLLAPRVKNEAKRYFERLNFEN